MSEVNFKWILHCKEDTHDKVWGCSLTTPLSCLVKQSTSSGVGEGSR